MAVELLEPYGSEVEAMTRFFAAGVDHKQTEIFWPVKNYKAAGRSTVTSPQLPSLLKVRAIAHCGMLKVGGLLVKTSTRIRLCYTLPWGARKHA